MNDYNIERKETGVPIKVFVSGTFEIIHGGHIQFFKEAKALGDYLIVSFASDDVLFAWKGRDPVMSESHRRNVLESLRMVDEVVIGTRTDDPVFDFMDEFDRIKPQILVSTVDDKYAERKMAFCQDREARYIQLPKDLDYVPTSTTQIRAKLAQLSPAP